MKTKRAVSAEQVQQDQYQVYEEYLTRCWHKVREAIPDVRRVSGALDGLQVLIENLSDAPIQGKRFNRVGCLVGLVRDRVDAVEKDLNSTQGHWMDEYRARFQNRDNSKSNDSHKGAAK
jgi:hypothetical protein